MAVLNRIWSGNKGGALLRQVNTVQCQVRSEGAGLSEYCLVSG